MTMSCVWSSIPLIYNFIFGSRVHKLLTNRSSFGEMHPSYKRDVADPLRSYSLLFFRMYICFSVDKYSLCNL
jgi:hypothetical protein